MTFLCSISDVEDDHLPVSFNTVAVLISPVFSEVSQLLSSIWVLSQGWWYVAEYIIDLPVSLNSICSNLSGLLRDSPIRILSGGALSNRKYVKEDNMPVSLIICSHLSGCLRVFFWNALSGWTDVKEEVMLDILNSYTHIISGRIPWRFLSSIPGLRGQRAIQFFE